MIKSIELVIKPGESVKDILIDFAKKVSNHDNNDMLLCSGYLFNYLFALAAEEPNFDINSSHIGCSDGIFYGKISIKKELVLKFNEHKLEDYIYVLKDFELTLTGGHSYSYHRPKTLSGISDVYQIADNYLEATDM